MLIKYSKHLLEVISFFCIQLNQLHKPVLVKLHKLNLLGLKQLKTVSAEMNLLLMFIITKVNKASKNKILEVIYKEHIKKAALLTRSLFRSFLIVNKNYTLIEEK